VQVRSAVVPGQLRLSVLSLEQRGQLVEEAVVVAWLRDPDQARAAAGQVRRWARALGVTVLEAGAAELS